MTEPILFPKITREQAEPKIREIVIGEPDSVELLDHAGMRMIEREITLKQVMAVLKTGELIGLPEWDTEKERGWKCRFRRTYAGDNITVSAKLVERENLCCLVVTVF